MTKPLAILVRLCVLTAALVGGAIYYATGLLNHDTSYLILGTDRWLGGATLYRDIMETNPPLIFYLTAPAVLLSKSLTITAPTAFVIFLCAAAACSLVWCWRLLSRIPALPPAGREIITCACFLALIVIPANSFGQREHLFLITALPYFLAQILRPNGVEIRPVEKIALGAFALVGFALKPYFLLPAMFGSLVLCRQQRSLRPLFEPDNIVLGAGYLVYAAFVALIYPEYFSLIVPLGLRIYGAIGYGLGVVIDRSILPVLLIVALATLGDSSKPIRNSLSVLSAIMAGLLGAYVMQAKGWPYQILPFESMAIIACTLAVIVTAYDLKARPLHFFLFAIVPAMLLLKSMNNRYQNIYAEVFSTKLRELSPDWRGKSLLLLSTDDYAAFPLINELGAQWAGRYPYQWIVAGALSRLDNEKCPSNSKSCAELNTILEYGRRTNVDDFVVRAPDVVLIDNRPLKTFFPDKPFDYIDFLKSDPRFPEIWRHYRKADSALDYDIWLRVPDAPVSKLTSGGVDHP